MLQSLLAWLQDATGIGRPGRRKWIFVSIAIVLFAVGRYLENVDRLRALRDFAWSVVRELGRINFFSFAGAYLDHVRCGVTERLGAPYTVCNGWRFAYPPNYIVALPQAAMDTMKGNTPLPALLVYVIAFATAAAATNYLWRRHVVRLRESHIWDIVAIALGSVIVTTIIALAMQVTAIVLFAVFGAVMGLMLLLAGDFRWVKELVQAANKLRKVAQGDVSIADVGAQASGAVLGKDNPLNVANEVSGDANKIERLYNWLARKFGR
ncbi:hypothetical protein BH10PSE9_BH10PSE9_01810 [soil metagenome]